MKKYFSLFKGIGLALLGACLITSSANGQSVTFDFQDGTDQGFGTGFGNDASASFSIVNIGGSLRMAVPDTASFQQAGRESQGADAFLAVMNTAMLNPGVSTISYDWYIDTSGGNQGTFLQLGTYINSGDGGYLQDFAAVKDVELNGAQLASGQVFSGTVTETLSAKYGALPGTFLNQSFLRLGLISNGDGTAVTVYYDNITITAVPEPTSLALCALGAGCLVFFRRRKA